MAALSVVGRRDAWEQRQDEPDDAYLAFMQWLVADPRPMPGTRMASLYDWGGRARAFDRKGNVRSTSESMKRSLRALVTIADLETDKLLKRVEATDAECLDVREKLAVHAFLQGMSNLNDMISDKNEIDLSKLSNEDLEKIRDARKRLARAVS